MLTMNFNEDVWLCCWTHVFISLKHHLNDMHDIKKLRLTGSTKVSFHEEDEVVGGKWRHVYGMIIHIISRCYER